MQGLENVLAAEIQNIGGENIRHLVRAVSFIGTQETLYKANMFLRTALKVLKPITFFRAENEEALYKAIKRIAWEDYMSIDDTLAVEATVASKYFTHSHYIVQKTKDAIVDRFRERTGKRPSVHPGAPTLRIHIHITHNTCDVALNSSGDSLFRRGYKTATGTAPINEVLAAGMLLLAGWDGSKAFVDTMCGSGTLLIEAALIAMHIAPGSFRKNFGFQYWNDFDEKLFERIRLQAARQIKKCAVPIVGCDINEQAVTIAWKNIAKAGLSDVINVSRCAMADYNPPPPSGILISNPPYGERLRTEELSSLYRMIGSTLKHRYAGYEAWIISSSIEAFTYIALHHVKNITLFNGPLECRFRKYEMYEGSKRLKKQ